MYIQDATIGIGRILEKVTGFEWDTGNKGKNLKHKVADEECEEVFFDPRKVIQKDKLHSQKEERFILIGKTNQEKLLYVSFTIRKDKIRIISARDLNKKEYKLYEEKT